MADWEKEVRHRFGVAQLEEGKHPRFSLHLPIEYSPAPSPTRSAGGAGNAGEGSLIVHLRKNFEVGQLLRLKLFFSSGADLDTVEMLSRVIWTETLEEAEYRCGMKFVDISPENRNKWTRLLTHLSPLSN